MKKYSLGALVAAGLLVGGLSAGSASAADLGGNCCADLEERIAELEATTARKGNRKVSLTISGWVAEQVMWWDDGFEQNAYVQGIGSTLSSHVKFTGQATISPGWYAGYVLQIEADGVQARTENQDTTGLKSGAFAPNVLQSFWFIKSDHLGKLGVGLQSQASDNTAILVDGSGSLVPANWVTFTGDTFFLRNSGGGGVFTDGAHTKQATWSSLMFCHSVGAGVGGDCNGVPLDSVRYDSPTFGGFSVSASWGEDDFWDVAARYAGEHGGFKVAVAAAYSEVSDEELLINTGVTDKDSKYFQIGGYIEHTATGLWVYGAYGHEESDHLTAGGRAIPDSDDYYIKAGLRERWTPLGHTVLYGFWGQYNDAISDALLDENVTGSEMEVWGVGVVQEIDAAAMSLWVHYQRNQGTIDCGSRFDSGPGNACINNVTPQDAADLEDWQSVKAGALINF